MKKFFRVFMIGLIGLFLTSCGQTKLACNNTEGIKLIKSLYIKNVAIPQILDTTTDLSLYAENWNQVNKNYQYCITHTSSNKYCSKYMKLFTQLKTKYVDEINDNVILKNYFIDKKDKQSKTIYCHADLYVHQLNGNKLAKITTVSYKLQISEDGDYIEGTLLDY